MADLSANLFKKIRRIQFQTTHFANDILAGAYLSAFKGKGMEFEEVREYQSGDDIRNIDWNVTARMRNPYVKNFREERELTVTLIVDISASTRFGTTHQLKSDLIAEIAAVIAFSAIKNNDKVSLILFSESVEKYLPPKKGTRHVLRVIRELLATEPKSRGTNINAALAFLGKVQRRSSVCFLISDFICPDFSHSASIIAKKHDMIALAIIDPREAIFPNMSLVNVADLETGQMTIIDSSTSSLNKMMQASLEERLRKQKQLMQRLGAGFVKIDTNTPYLPLLKKFFKIREKRHR